MSVAGLDLGNLNCVAAVARKRGIDVIANEASRRETSSLVAFRENQRVIGDQAAAQLTSNLPNTINGFKRLLGKKWNNEAKNEFEKSCFTVKQGDSNAIEFEVDYQGTMKSFTPEQITAMMITQMRKIIEKDSEGKIKLQELVISVPSFFTDSQRRALKDAAYIANVNCVQLLSEPLAAAIPWGMYRKDLPEDDKPTHVMFANFGESTLSVAVVAMSKTKVNVLSTASDPNLGGRDFDTVLVNHFADIIQEQYKIDVRTSKRAMIRLRTQCERVKKVLTTGPEAPLYVESIMNDIDVKSSITRKDFQNLCGSLVERASNVIVKAMEDAKLESLDIVEVIGGCSYVALFQEKLQELTKVNQLSHTLNKSEAVARGCALQCAIVSPQFHINRTATIKDCNPYSIRLTWNEGEKKKSAILFEKGCSLGISKRVTFPKPTSEIEISADYASEEEFPFTLENINIGKFIVPKFESTCDSEKLPTVEVMFKLDHSGIFNLKHAKAIETETYMESVPAEKKDDTSSEKKDETKTDEDGDAVMTEIKKERKKITDLAVSIAYTGGFSKEQLDKLRQEEFNMQNADELAETTAEARNAVESYAYDAQGKLQYDFSEWTEFSNEEEKTKLLSLIDEILAWLYGEGDSATKDEYLAKLSDMQALGSPIELRKNECETRGPASDELRQAINYYKAFVATKEEKYEHIGEEKRQKVTDKVNEIEDWFVKLQEKQEALPKNADPVILTISIQKKKDDLSHFCNAIVNTPKPKKTEEKPKKEDSMETEESKSSETKSDTEAKGETEQNDAPPAAEEGKIEEVGDEVPPPPVEDMDVD